MLRTRLGTFALIGFTILLACPQSASAMHSSGKRTRLLATAGSDSVRLAIYEEEEVADREAGCFSDNVCTMFYIEIGNSRPSRKGEVVVDWKAAGITGDGENSRKLTDEELRRLYLAKVPARSQVINEKTALGTSWVFVSSQPGLRRLAGGIDRRSVRQTFRDYVFALSPQQTVQFKLNPIAKLPSMSCQSRVGEGLCASKPMCSNCFPVARFVNGKAVLSWQCAPSVGSRVVDGKTERCRCDGTASLYEVGVSLTRGARSIVTLGTSQLLVAPFDLQINTNSEAREDTALDLVIDQAILTSRGELVFAGSAVSGLGGNDEHFSIFGSAILNK